MIMSSDEVATRLSSKLAQTVVIFYIVIFHVKLDFQIMVMIYCVFFVGNQAGLTLNL